MSDTAPPEPSTSSGRFERVVEQFLCEREQGGNPDPQRCLHDFPDLAPLLREFFAGLDLFDRLAPDLAPTTPPILSAQETCPGLGDRVGNFELLSVLGRGGMGVVYKARQTNLNRVVALKMILSGSHASPSELARFRGEAEAVARLNHPNVVQVYEVGEIAGLPFFSLEYVEGGSLDRKLARSPLPPNEAAALVEKLARAMAVAHAAGLIHRDLKPGNVLLAADGTPKITDFGLAKKLDTAGQTVSGTVLGTPSYMAPEQASGHSQAIGPAADVYALGATLYECLTGRPPFKAANPLDTMLQVLSDNPLLHANSTPAPTGHGWRPAAQTARSDSGNWREVRCGANSSTPARFAPWRSSHMVLSS